MSETKIVCPNCGVINKEGSKYCAECGLKIIIEDNQQKYYEEYNPAYGRLTKFAAKKLDNSKLVDKLIDVTTPNTSKFDDLEDSEINLSILNHSLSLENEFLEVYETIDDGFLRALFLLERRKIGGGGNLGATAVAVVSKPAGNMSHKDAIEFYENLLKEVEHDLNVEKQKPNFNKREYYKKRYKEYFVENLSNMGVPRHLR